MQQTNNVYDNIVSKFNQRYKTKKITNIIISFIISILGITSFIYGTQFDRMPIIFRWLTVDGTLFTTFGALFFILVNLIEIFAKTELTSISIYYIRLSCAVAESVIILCVIISQLPAFSEHLQVFTRYDNLCMHLFIPILGISSFIINDSPIGKIPPLKVMRGTWFITCYAFTLVALIQSNVLKIDMIPYYFFNYRENGLALMIIAFILIYIIGYLMACLLSYLNRKLSWLWFKNITKF